jgi:hypothetical protein
MAFYVAMTKLEEDGEGAEYEFGLDNQKPGRLRINKLTGEVSLIIPAGGDERQAAYFRAASKVSQHWKEGCFPDRTSWAS